MQEMFVLGSLAAIFLFLIISPGPNFLVITQITVTESRAHGISAGLGVATGSVLWAILAATGLGVLFAGMPGLQPALQVAGGLYLLYIGRRIWRGAASALGKREVDGGMCATLGQAYRYGLMTNMTNPKALAFYTSVFTSLVRPELAGWVRVAAVGVIAVLAATWFVSLATLFSVSRVQAKYRQAKYWIDRVTGLFLLAFGVRMLYDVVHAAGLLV